MKYPFLVDVPVALIFFARPDVLTETFSAIKDARPSKLFLIQDGARQNNPDDIKNIELCRKIVSEVDWECDIIKFYSNENLGCGMNIFYGISKAFQYVDRLIIIEDDCVPGVSFFKFCEIILEKYKDDERIDMISGMNHLNVYKETPYDYIFSKAASPWGWATWQRVWCQIDYSMNFLMDREAVRLLTNLHGKNIISEGQRKLSVLNSGQKLSSWSYQKGIRTLLQSGLIITPKYNLVTNIGLTENSANSGNSLKLIPKGLRRVYFIKNHNLTFPLHHPIYVINDIYYRKKVDRIMGNGYPFVKLYRTFESGCYRLIHGDFKGVIKSIKRRIIN